MMELIYSEHLKLITQWEHNYGSHTYLYKKDMIEWI